jgi:PhzF family phenazine biosynthesis protein
MRTYKFKKIDAFTDRAYTGNPAAVVMVADGLQDDEMQLIAREMNLSETAFLFSPTDKTYDLNLRWMTPAVEVDLCGHATIAAFHALAELGLYGLDAAGDHSFRVKTKSGVLPIHVYRDEKIIRVTMGLPVPTFEKYGGQKSDLCNAFSVPMELLDNSLPIWKANNGYVFIPFINREPLLKMKPDSEALKNLSAKHSVTAFCAFTTDTKYQTSAAHSRFFAPLWGVDEDPVTGSAQGPLACYLYQNGRVRGNGKIPVTLEQGYEIARGGRVWAELTVEGDNIVELTISGYAVTVMDGQLYI